MRVRSIAVTVVSVVLAVGGALPSAALPSDVRPAGAPTARELLQSALSVPAAGAGAAWVINGGDVQRDGGADPTMRAIDALRRTGSGAEAARALLGLPVRGPGQSQAGSDEASAEEGEGATAVAGGGSIDAEALRYASPAPDLDGDGMADVLVTTYWFATDTSTTAARRGVDGSHLWTADGDVYAIPLADVDGDEVPDLLSTAYEILEESSEYDCDESRCRFAADVELITTVAVRSGRTGETRWSERIPGWLSYEEEFDGVGDAYRYAFTSEGAIVTAEPTADGTSVVQNTVDVDALDERASSDPTGTDTGLVEERTETVRVRAATDAQIVDARTGEPLAGRGGGGSTVALLRPTGDLVGDSTADLLWAGEETTDTDVVCTTVLGEVERCDPDTRGTTTLIAEVLDGADLDRAWLRRSQPVRYGFQFDVGADLDGDGAGELFQFADSGDDEGSRFVTTVLSGRTGTVLWSRTTSDFLFPLGFGDVDADGDQDVLTSVVRLEDIDFQVDVHRVDGRSGQSLSVSTLPRAEVDEGPCAFWFLYVGGMTDVDGDQVDDLFAGEVAVSYDGEDCDSTERTRSVAVGESGADATRLYRVDVDGWTTGFPVGDLDGDGTTDLLLEAMAPAQPEGTATDDGGETSRANALRLPDLEPIWTLDVPPWTFLTPLGDLDGDAGTDLAQPTDTGDLVIRRGVDATALWSLPLGPYRRS
jgi:hypothetical protein